MSLDFVESFTILLPDFSESNIDFSESFNSKHGLIIEIAAIHEGLTSNYNHYTAGELEKALQSWVEPYPKPIILNHDLNSEAIGRVIAAKMDKDPDGSFFVRLQVAITDPIAAQKVLDKRYLTGSVGGRAGKAVCSISGEDLAQEDGSGRPRAAKYKRGKVYKGKVAYIDMQDISFKEYSFVNLPADSKSGVRSTKLASDGGSEIIHSDWVAKSAAFILHMETEDITSVEDNKSVLKEMKKKESKPTYLHLKGAFLSALALHESESDIHKADSLLSNEDSDIINSKENQNMDDVNKDEDILAVAVGLSEDLSTIAAAAANTEESEDSTEETVVSEDVTSEEEVEESSTNNSEEADVQEDVDSENAEELVESSSTEDEVQEEVQEHDDLKVEESPEHDAVELTVKIALLEEENTRLKSALHMTLVERVIDTKIGLGIESVEDREKLLAEHVTRTASSLADSLRDLAKMPVKVNKRISDFITIPEITSEAEINNGEENVVTIDKVEEEIHVSPVDSFEQVLVDALMGRRKL
jgi:hypothetical protein